MPSILVVDDELDIRLALADVLADGGRRVATASDGYDALQKLDLLERPCLVLLDLMMPRMSGLDFLAHLSDAPGSADVSVLVMSAHDGLRREAERYRNVRGSLRKPFDIDGLLSLVDVHGAESSGTSTGSAAL
jgi:CheY-like chemotaxis protein